MESDPNTKLVLTSSENIVVVDNPACYAREHYLHTGIFRTRKI